MTTEEPSRSSFTPTLGRNPLEPGLLIGLIGEVAVLLLEILLILGRSGLWVCPLVGFDTRTDSRVPPLELEGGSPLRVLVSPPAMVPPPLGDG